MCRRRTTTYFDQFAGEQQYDVAGTVGDFLVGAKGGMPGYQLAVVVDDARQRIDRGRAGRRSDSRPLRDKYCSTTDWDLALRRATPTCPWCSARTDVAWPSATATADCLTTGLKERALSGLSALLAEWCGCGARREMSAAEFLSVFDLQSLT